MSQDITDTRDLDHARRYAGTALGRAALSFQLTVEAADHRSAQEERKPKVHRFATSADALALVDQDAIPDGDVILVEAEGLVAYLVGIWPVAVTAEGGPFKPHDYLGRPVTEYADGSWVDSAAKAEEMARFLGFPIAGEPTRTVHVRIGTHRTSYHPAADCPALNGKRATYRGQEQVTEAQAQERGLKRCARCPEGPAKP
ncbi:hypothetical protein ACFY64_31695 [Streptomyces collinus]|uniref:hypothetical protein n=1 Tax=Streptomyces collinus TaxID=42684 RepID=UPI0036C8432A